jgi:hypothetical protein
MKRLFLVVFGLAALISVTFWLVAPAPVPPRAKPGADLPESSAPVSVPVAVPKPASQGTVKFANGQQRMPVQPGVPSASPKAGTPLPTNTVRLKGASPLVPGSIPPPPPGPPPVVDATVEKDLEKVSFMLRDYRTLMGENPVGSNAEIMKAVMGGNPRGATLGPPDGETVNANGELVDHWGTPYFFHQLSADHMEIRSAGPDQKMWTTDDVVRK